VEDEAQRRKNPASHFNFLYHVIFLGLGLGLLCCGGKIGVEGKIIGNDQRRRNARRREMVWRVRKGRKSDSGDVLEQSGNGWDVSRMLWRGLKKDKG
jgi:hypothetical protein